MIKEIIERLVNLGFPFDVQVKSGMQELWIKAFGPSEKYLVLKSDGTWQLI